MIRRDAASERQVQAADPRGSTWLSANAGSGKTRVLTDRVARLLIAGVDPQKILCLTYTKAAASEMQNRLFKRLGEWAMKPSDALADALRDLGVEGVLSPEDLRHARTLFARAIETPGGLKIQTIHSFCASLLRRFPLEAGVSPQFIEMDDRTSKRMREEIVEAMAEGDDIGLVDDLAQHYTGEDFDRLTREIAGQRPRFASADPADLMEALGLPEGLSEATLEAQVFDGGEGQLLRDLCAALLTGTKTDVTNAGKLEPLLGRDLTLADLPILEGVFLFGATAKAPFSAKLETFPTKSTRANIPLISDQLNAFMERVEAARETRLALAALRKTKALHGFADRFLALYDAAKLARGWLDFDDLILKARALLNDPAVAAWVLFRLDGGIDHILVDEAQDTSPTQWDVVEKLAQEFTAGEGAREADRTIFVVGDKKQSIYSFQGADPAGFDRMKEAFRDRLGQIGAPFQDLPLLHSFRSSPAILEVVDATLRDHAGIGETLHAPFHENMPGRVDLWPVIAKTEDPPDSDWFDPVDQIAENHETVVLARQVARSIKEMLANGSLPAGDSFRPITPGDVLILVQRRSDLFHEIIRACKAEALDIAGADRLKIGAELAVKDLTSLLAFLALPEDDLALAEVLKSPLLGWSEQQLFDLAHHRPEKSYLWAALRDRQAEHPSDFEMLSDLRRQSDFLRPYDLIERILTRHKGREALLARLGIEAEDGINALLSQAMAFERIDVPSLTGFLAWLEADDVEIKRQMDSAGDRIRVMTVHGAKGLEAPIVILPDCAARRVEVKEEIYPSGENLFWKSRSEDSPAAIRAARDRLRQKLEEERERLLYVAMTRAEAWLIVCAAGELGKDGKSWHDKIAAGLERVAATEVTTTQGPIQRYEVGTWQEAQGHDAPQKEASVPLPGWIAAPCVAPLAATTALAPSDLGGAKSLAGFVEGDEDELMRRGRQIHLLLEVLPSHAAETHEDLAKRLLSQGEDQALSAEIPGLLEEVTRILLDPSLSFLFNGNSLAEVPLTADLPELSRKVHGKLDRLIVADDHVMAIDFKSNVHVPTRTEDVPDGLLRQMGAYASALEQIYPGRRIELAILWTKTASLMRLSHEDVIASLQRAGHLDLPHATS